MPETLERPLVHDIAMDKLKSQIKEWETLSNQIKAKRDAFEASIAGQLNNKRDLQEKIFSAMEKLNQKTLIVDNITAKIIESSSRKQGPTPTEKVTILMSKINAATKKIVQAAFDAATREIPVAGHRSIKSASGLVSEGIADTISSIGNKLGQTLKQWISGLKDFFGAVDELEKLAQTMNESREVKIGKAIKLIEKITGKRVILTPRDN